MTEQTPQTQHHDLSPADLEKLNKSRRKRSIVLGLALGALVVMFYVLTVVKMGPAVFERML